MTMYAFENLRTVDLVVDATYQGGSHKNAKDDPLDPLLSVGNQGGFRARRTPDNKGFRARRTPDGKGHALVVLYSTFADPDWPDHLDVETGVLTYFGDNKKPGSELHVTPRRGNRLLRESFDAVHGDPPARDRVPPFFVFAKAGPGRDVRFRGLAVPGGVGMSRADDLVAVWRTSAGARFQNYKALFTILDVRTVSRAWIGDLLAGTPMSQNAPAAWVNWVRTGAIAPLTAPRTLQWRPKAEQLPKSAEGRAIVEAIHAHFEPDPYAFEACAAELAKMMDRNIISCELTRPYRDGGRDAVGKYRIGPPGEAISVDFALEAKCYGLNHSVTIRHTTRLISRLRHRQFGIFVTTSFLADQAYQELRVDSHPVVVICAADIVDILRQNGITTLSATESWLQANFPVVPRAKAPVDADVPF